MDKLRCSGRPSFQVIVGMIAGQVVFCQNLFEYSRMFSNVITYTKKCRLGIEFVQHIQNIVGKLWYWPIIKSQEYLFFVGIDFPYQVFEYFFNEAGGFVEMEQPEVLKFIGINPATQQRDIIFEVVVALEFIHGFDDRFIKLLRLQISVFIHHLMNLNVTEFFIFFIGDLSKPISEGTEQKLIYIFQNTNV